MAIMLRYGEHSCVELDISSERLVAICQAPRGVPLDDVRGAVAAALENPRESPPLRAAVVPGDRVVLVVAEGLPQASAIVGAVVAVLLEAGVVADDITILHTAEAAGRTSRDLVRDVGSSVADHLKIIQHDPTDRVQLSYLASSAEGKPIYLNREILDADLVLPLGCLHLDDVPGYFGVAAGVFPAFSDIKSLQRYRSPVAHHSDVQHRRLCKEAAEVTWLLGLLFTVQVVPAGGGGILHVLAGDPRKVHQRGRELCRAEWSYEVPSRASLVIVGIEGDANQQTWDNVDRALFAARGVVADDGAIAVCTDLEARPGPAMQQLAAADDIDVALREIGKLRPADALPTVELARALEHGKVYLLSRLDESVVEELGIAPVSEAEQIARLAARHPSCIVLANAQYAAAKARGE